MRRFLTLVCLLGLALPAGISITGCVRNPAGKYCNGQGYGLLDTAVSSIILQPQIAGISLAYGQTTQVQAPQAYTCKESPATVSSALYSYGTTNNQLVDISPSGNICAGTWNRNTGGGIADYTYCNYPNPLPSTNGLPYALAYITATADAVTSNPVTVYIHAPVSSINLVTTPLAGAAAEGCFSQNQQAQLDAQAFYSLNGTQTQLCAPNSTTLPDCSNSIGTLNFQVGTASIASINSTTNVITAAQPGTTAITATIAQSSSSAGYFSTCPPASIHVGLANGETKGVVTQGVTQNLTTTVYDTNTTNCPPNGCVITGLALSYQSTNPVDISAGSGSITASFPGVASVYATCEPPTCNPAPINEIGLYGTGLALASNPVDIIVPGTASNFAWFGAPGQSQYFSSIELLTGAPSSNVRLPYVPNSMLMDEGGNSLYFGSERELMIYSTANNGLTKQDPTVPGIVLAVSPNNSQILINDQIRGLFYLYNVTGGTAITQGGLAACSEASPAPCKAAAWTPDSNTLYVVDSAALGGNHTDTLYVYNIDTGWSSTKLACSTSNTSPTVCDSALGTNLPDGAQNVAVTVPGIGAYLSGNPVVAHTWCPSGTVGNNASILFYPQPSTDSIAAVPPVDSLGATSDGDHMLGASLAGSSITLTDIGLNIPPSTAYPSAECPITISGSTQTLSPLSTNPVIDGTANLTGVTSAAAVNQVVTGQAPTTASVNTAAPIAFVTYSTSPTSTSAAPLPYYLPQASGAGPVNYVTLNDSNVQNPPTPAPSPYPAPTAPLFGVFSPDDTTFFVSTAGDNAIHFITIPTTLTATPALTDSQQYLPDLPACTPVANGGSDAGCDYPATLPVPTSTTYVPVTVITVKPRSVT
jgi:trimeric autotransporter adhesin